MADVPISLYTSVVKLTGENVAPPSLPPSLEETQPAINPPGTSDISGLVPYNGAIDKVNLGEKGISTGFVQYDTTPTDTPTGSGTVVWNPDKYTLDLSMGLGDSVQQIGMETYYTPVKNQTGSLIPDGTFVMATGSLGASGRITVAPAVTDGSVDSRYMLGVTTHDIANGGDGLVTWFGEIRGFNTNTKAPIGETWVDGTVLWNNPAVAGGFTSVEPQAPNLKIPVAIVISAGNNGVIFVRPRLGMRLTDLHDVDAFTPSDKDLISYDSALGHWNAKSLGSVIGGTSSQFLKGDGSLDSNTYALASQINIASGQVAFGTGTGTIGGDSGLTWDNSAKSLGIGTSSPIGKQTIISTGAGLATIQRIGRIDGSAFCYLQFNADPTGFATEIRTSGSTNPSFSIWTSNVNRIHVLSTGQVGIATTSPTNTLDVNGTARIRTLSNATGDFVTASATGVLQKRTASETRTDIGAIGGSGITNYLSKFTASGTIGNSQIFDNGTNVGIGTSSPSAKLEVSGAGIIVKATASGSDSSYFQAVNGSYDYVAGIATSLGYGLMGMNSDYPLVIMTNATERMRITSGGNVLIGTTTDSGQKLQVNGSTYINGNSYRAISANFTTGFATIDILQNNNRRVFFGFAEGALTGGFGVVSDAGVEHTINIVRSNGNVLIGTITDSGQRLQVSGNAYISGNVGIGTSSPSAKLQSNSDSSFTVPITAFNTNNNFDLNPTVTQTVLRLFRNGKEDVTYSSSVDFGISRYENSGFSARTQMDIRLSNGNTSIPEVTVMSLRGNGNVGIGTTSPTNILDVNGTARVRTLTGTTGYLPLLSSTGVMGQSVAYNAGTGIVINGTFLPSGAVFSVNGVSFFNNFNTGSNYNLLSIDFGENKGFGYNSDTNEIFIANNTSSKIPVKIDTDAPTDSLVINASGNVSVGSQLHSPVVAKGNSSTAVTFDWNDGNIQTVTLTANCTFTFSNPQSGASYQIIITQDATGGRTITWPVGIYWEGKTIPALTGTANSRDIVTITYDGTNYNALIARNFGT